MTTTLFKAMSVTTAAMLAAMILLPAVIVLPATGSARSTDAAYCESLVDQYQRYIDRGSARSRLPQSVQSLHVVELCKTGDTSGISGIERALEGARIPLPPRG